MNEVRIIKARSLCKSQENDQSGRNGKLDLNLP